MLYPAFRVRQIEATSFFPQPFRHGDDAQGKRVAFVFYDARFHGACDAVTKN
jgi:hypothetical protein